MATNGHYRRRNRIGAYPSPASVRSSAARHATPEAAPVAVDSILGGLRQDESRSLGAMIDAMRRDYQISFADTVLQANLSSVAVTVSTESGDPRATAICESLQSLWDRHLPEMGKAIGDGRVAFQKRPYYCEKSGINTIRRLDALPFRQTEMEIDDDGCFTGIKLTGKAKAFGETQSVTLSPDLAWWLALDATVIEPHGRSRYLGALQEEWTNRREIFDLRMNFLRKFCLRGGVMRGPATVYDEKNKVHISAATAIEGAFKALRQGGMMYLPDTRDKNGNFAFDWQEPEKLNDPAPIDATIRESDIRVLRALGISELSVQQAGDLGSFAMAVMHRLILNAVVGGIIGQFVESFDEYVAAKVFAWNFYPEEMPEWIVNYPDMTAVPDSLMVEVAKSILTAAQLPPAAALINLRSVFEVAGVPITEDFEARLERALAAADAAQQAIQLPAFGGFPGQMNPQRQPIGETGSTPRTMANEVPTPQPESTLPQAIPSVREVLFAAEQRAAEIHGQIYTLAASLANTSPFNRTAIEAAIRSAYDELRELAAETQTTIRVLGMLSPWVPKVQDNPAGVARPRPLMTAMALEDRTQFRWPFMENAIDFLRNKQVVTQDQFDTLSRQDRQLAFSIPQVNDVQFLAEVRDEIATSIGAGETLESFRERMQQRVGLRESQINTLFRTNTHQAYLEGQERALESPPVAELFPYVLYAATRDTRTDPAHAAADGFVVRRGTPEHRVLLTLLRRYNCRCALIPLTEEDARERGIKTYADLPAVILDAAGLVTSRTFTNAI